MKLLFHIHLNKIFFSVCSFIVILTIISINSFALPSNKIQSNSQFYNQNETINNLAAIGITYIQDKNNINVTVDQQKALSSIPMLNEEGEVSRLDAEAANTAPLSVSVAIIGVSSTLKILNYVFSNNGNINKIHVNGYVVPIGGTKKQACYSFDYDRNDFNNLDLNIIKPRKFITNTVGFKFSNWCMGIINDEASKLNGPSNSETT